MVCLIRLLDTVTFHRMIGGAASVCVRSRTATLRGAVGRFEVAAWASGTNLARASWIVRGHGKVAESGEVVLIAYSHESAARVEMSDVLLNWLIQTKVRRSLNHRANRVECVFGSQRGAW